MDEIDEVLTEYGVIIYDKSKPREEQWEMAPKWPEKPYEQYDRYIMGKISESDYESWMREAYNFEVAPLGLHKIDFDNAPKCDSPDMTLWDIADLMTFDDFEIEYEKACEEDEEKTFLDKKNSYGYSLMHEALHGRHVQTLFFLLDEGADPNIQDNSGNTLLHYLAKEDICDPVFMMIDKLLEAGADVNIANNEGTTPLTVAASKSGEFQSLFRIQKLKNAGGDISVKNRFGMSARELARIKKEKFSDDLLERFVER